MTDHAPRGAGITVDEFLVLADEAVSGNTSVLTLVDVDSLHPIPVKTHADCRLAVLLRIQE